MKRRIPPQRASDQAPVSAPAFRSKADQSLAAKLMTVLKKGGDARRSKVKRVRESVLSKTYENDLKLSVALDRLTRDLSA